LLSAGANVNDTYDDGKGIWCSDIEHWKRTPLMHAAQHADAAMLKILIDSGANISVKDILGDTALAYAEKNDMMENEAYLKSLQPE
jgi:hypothetical protein